MEFDKLPPLELIGVASRKRDAMAAMMVATMLQPGQGFNFYEPVQDAPGSGRILYLEHLDHEIAPFPHPQTAVHVVSELLKLGNEARYPDYPKNHEPGQLLEGWSFHQATINGARALVILCEWTCH
jgi:hypothetical protein